MAVENNRFAGTDKKFFTVHKVGGINTRQTRTSIKDEQFSWIENMQPIDDGTYRALFSNSTTHYTATGGLTIVYIYMFNAGSTPYGFLVLSDGSAVSVNINTNVATNVAGAGTFWSGGTAFLPAAVQVGQGGIVIVATVGSNNYWAWDGSTLSSPGGSVPAWLGSGTMPNGIHGTSVEIFQSRVWIGNNNTITWSAPGNGGDFTTADGSGSSTSTDSFLRLQFTSLKQANGFLYLFGDSSVNVISNVQTAGSPTAVTTFNNQNVDPQSGAGWFNGVQVFSRGLVFTNYIGVYALFGGSSQKVSDDIDGLFNPSVQLTIVGRNPSLQPSTAIANINAVTTFMLLIPLKAPFDSSFRNALAMWDGKKWYIGSQSVPFTFITSRQILSTLQTWGTDGTNFFQLFTTGASTQKYWQTKFFSGEGPQTAKQPMRMYTTALDNTGTGITISTTLEAQLEANTSSTTQALSTTVPVTTPPVNYLTGVSSTSISVRGNYLGWTSTSTNSDFTLTNQQLLYQEQSPIGG